MEYSFSASGWLFIYQLGVARTFQLSKVHLPPTCIRCTGSSGGSLVSACLAIDTDINAIKTYFLECVEDCKQNPTKNAFKMRDYVEGAFEKVKRMGPRTKGDDSPVDFHDHESILNNRLGVSVTTLPNCENHIIMDFDTQNEIEQAILGSCTMSPFAGFPFRLKRKRDKKLHNKWVFDGGLSNIQPHTMKDKSAIVNVSVFSHWDSDIRPSRYVPLHWTIHPPRVSDMEALFFLGMHDAERYINNNQQKFRDFSVSTKENAANDQIILGEELSDMVAEEENKSYSVFDAEDTKRGRRAPTFEDVEEEPNLGDKAMDEMTAFSQKNLVKMLAMGSIYAEQGYMAAYNFGKGMVLGVENSRRGLVSPSDHFFSIRRWLPSSLLGSSSDSLSESAANVKNLFKFREIWREIGRKEGVIKDQESIGSSALNDVDHTKANNGESFVKNSFMYKKFLA